jgi:zinc protease
MKFNVRAFKLSGLLAVLAPLCGCYHAPPPPGLRMHAVKLPLDAYRLPSGMQVIIEEDHTSPIVGVVAVVSAGNADDPVGKEGLAHLVEHLTFRAKPDGKTERRNLLDYAAAGDVNAMTEPDDTVYWEFGPAKSLEGLIRIEANRLAAPLPGVDATTFDVERSVVENELVQSDRTHLPSEVLTWLAKAAFPANHPYARPPGGTPQSLAAISLADAQQFSRDLYLPSRTTWVVAGDVTREQVQALLMENLPKSAFAPAPVPVAPPASPPEPESPLTVAQHVSLAVTKPTLFLVWPLPPANSSSAVLDELISGVVEDSATRWVDEDIESASAILVPGERASMLACRITLKTGAHPEQTAKRVNDALAWVGKLDSDFPMFVFNRIQAQTITHLGMNVESLRARSVMRAVYAQTTHDPAAVSSALTAIQALTPDEVAAFAKKYLTADRERSVMVVPNPQASLLRELAAEGTRDGRMPDSLALWKQSASSELRASSSNAHVVFPLEATRALMVPLPLGERKVLTLKSGLRVVAVHRSGWPQITVALGMPGGIADAEPAGAGYLSQFASAVRHDNGVPASSGTMIDWNVDRDMTELQLTGGNGNLDNLLGLLADQVEEVRFSRWERLSLQKSLTEALEKDDQKPATQAARELRKALFGEGVFARWTPAKVADQLDEDAVNAWLDQVYQPGNATLAIVGDFDPETLGDKVEEWLGGWHGDGGPLPAPKVAWPQRTGAQLIVKAQPDSAQESVRLGCAGPAASYREALAYELLGEVLSEQLDQEARQELGGTYGFSSQVSWMRGGAAEIDLVSAVDNAHFTPVLSRLHRAWATLGLIPVSKAALGRARWKLASSYNLGLQTSSHLAQTLVRAYAMGLSAEMVDQLPELLTSITPEEVKAAAAHCRADSALSLVGDPAVAKAGLKAVWR